MLMVVDVFQILMCIYVRFSALCLVSRLVNALDDTSGRGRTWFVVHIDTKAEDVQKEMLEVFMDRPNVIVMEEDRCVWVFASARAFDDDQIWSREGGGGCPKAAKE